MPAVRMSTEKVESAGDRVVSSDEPEDEEQLAGVAISGYAFGFPLVLPVHGFGGVAASVEESVLG